MSRSLALWLSFLAPWVVFPVGVLHADDLPPPNISSAQIELQHTAVSGYADADSIGNRNVYAEGTLAPFTGIYESGFRLRLTGDASWYRFITNETPRTLGSGDYFEGALLTGYGFFVPGLNVNLLVGPAYGHSINEGVTTDRWGVKAYISADARPTDQTMFSGSATYSTIANDLQVQAKTGVKIFGNVYVGPETKLVWKQILPWQTNLSTVTAVSPQTSIATTRVGAHVSALSIGPAFIGVSGGWITDRQLGSGYYGSVNFYQPF